MEMFCCQEFGAGQLNFLSLKQGNSNGYLVKDKMDFEIRGKS